MSGPASSPRGYRLHASAFKRTPAWASIAHGRRIHDLRHTAARLWLARGVDPVTVQAWMGHASIATTNLYLHHLGTTADRAGLDRLNRRGHTQGAHAAWSSPNDTLQIREGSRCRTLSGPCYWMVELRDSSPTFWLRRHGVDLIGRERGVIDVQGYSSRRALLAPRGHIWGTRLSLLGDWDSRRATCEWVRQSASPGMRRYCPD
jgi:hypothetical protein